MSPKDHVILGGAAAATLAPFIGPVSLLFWVASFLIDLDHYMDYVYHNGLRDYSFKRMFEYHNTLELYWHQPEFLNLEVFHTIEFMTLLYLVTAYTGSIVLLSVWWGMLFHISLDLVYLWRIKIFFKRASSLTEYFIRKRVYERRGLRPTELYTRAAEIVNGGERNP